MASVAFIILLSAFAAVQGGVIPDNIDPRIVNGKNVTFGEIPYQVSLQTRSGHFCGGSVLNENYVITAAHCVQGTPASSLQVIAGTIDLNDPQVTRQASSIRVHNDYNPSQSWINDIALIKIDPPFKFSKNVVRVQLPKPNASNKVDEVAVVSGWGRLYQNGPLPSVLQKVEITIADQEYCRNVYSKMNLKVHDTQICAHDTLVEHGSCHGDSGGPLTVDGVLVGLVSWAQGCAQINYPTVYTRVSSYVDWIQKYSV